MARTNNTDTKTSANPKGETGPPLPPPKSSSPVFIEVEEERPVEISSCTTGVRCRCCDHVNPIDEALEADKTCIVCKQCTHETPIRESKDGSIFVRCTCEWLSRAHPSDFPIECDYCKRRLLLKVTGIQKNVKSYVCSSCNRRFETDGDKRFLRCPWCNEKSCLGKNYSVYRAFLFIIIGLLFICGDAAFIVLTLHRAHDHGGLYVGWAGFCIIGVGFLIGGCLYARIGKSNSYVPLQDP